MKLKRSNKLTVTKSDAKSTAGIIPLNNPFVFAHNTARTAFEATGVIEVDFAVLERIQHCRTHHQTRFSLAFGADRLVDDNMRFVFIYGEFIQSQ